MKKRKFATTALVLAVLLYILAYFFDDGENSVGDTMREVAQFVLTTEGQIDPSLILTPATPGPKVVGTAGTTPDGFYAIYFTDPTCPPLAERVNGLDSLIASDMLRAETQVDLAAFDLDAEPIVQALIALEQKGIQVRVVTDTDHAELESIQLLRRSGVEVVDDQRSGLMHNKFIIIDNRYLWVGSMNFTTNGVYCNNNNLVRFDAPALAENYRIEMDEMVIERSFGPRSPHNTPYEALTLHSIAVESYFSPERKEKLSQVIARAIQRAQQEILFMSFSFTHEVVGEAILQRAAAGVTVRGIFETVGAKSTSSYYPKMSAANLATLAVRLDGNPQVMHHKVIILDRQTVIFGSYNFSASADRSNDENVLVITDATFADHFVQEFERLWTQAQ